VVDSRRDQRGLAERGTGGIFWSAVALIVLTTIALLFLAKRSFEALRRR
jgi:hypothetical protein